MQKPLIDEELVVISCWNLFFFATQVSVTRNVLV